MTVENSVKQPAKSFAEVMNSFNKLTEIESRIDTAIQKAKVPWAETRKFLKGRDLNQVLNTPLAQFFQDLLREIGLGEVELSEKSNYHYIYRCKECPVCLLFKDIPNKKVCQPTADAISRFFTEAMEVEGETEETKCINLNDEFCEFSLTLQPFTLLEKALDNTDLMILEYIFGGGNVVINELANRLGIGQEEFQARLTTLIYYETLDENYNLTDVGKTFYNFRSKTQYKEEEYFDPPWKSMAELTSTIAATQSFAEALVVVTEEEELPWEVDEAEVVDVRERAKDKASFAELLTSEVKEEAKKEDEDESE